MNHNSNSATNSNIHHQFPPVGISIGNYQNSTTAPQQPTPTTTSFIGSVNHHTNSMGESSPPQPSLIKRRPLREHNTLRKSTQQQSQQPNILSNHNNSTTIQPTIQQPILSNSIIKPPTISNSASISSPFVNQTFFNTSNNNLPSTPTFTNNNNANIPTNNRYHEYSIEDSPIYKTPT
ncbi:predicted protein [Naegleria gruberi]|uniref:Predicted protein n=1 Tax=Naegleria gruberi TaxID=5762 RepID=D2W5N4_NAEGR|nr:uncharacterized protein NAEGRDRAFT_76725 [Naegleria gruberi]EFC35618.1 predicted protein [Naegleria gruberi]|eukprot:XP_002668362.1 predicted protein [Naegleria gruberi strain NEG-M]